MFDARQITVDRAPIHAHHATEALAIRCHIPIKMITLTAMRSPYSMKIWPMHVLHHHCSVDTEPFQHRIDVRIIRIVIIHRRTCRIIKISMNATNGILAVETILAFHPRQPKWATFNRFIRMIRALVRILATANTHTTVERKAMAAIRRIVAAAMETMYRHFRICSHGHGAKSNNNSQIETKPTANRYHRCETPKM